MKECYQNNVWHFSGWRDRQWRRNNINKLLEEWIRKEKREWNRLLGEFGNCFLESKEKKNIIDWVYWNIG